MYQFTKNEHRVESTFLHFSTTMELLECAYYGYASASASQLAGSTVSVLIEAILLTMVELSAC